MEIALQKTPPSDVDLGPLSAKVFEILARHTAFPWPILKAQARRANVDPANLTVEGLAEIVDYLARGVERFTSPETGSAVRRELQELAGS